MRKVQKKKTVKRRKNPVSSDMKRLMKLRMSHVKVSKGGVIIPNR